MMYQKFTFASFQSQFPQPATCLATDDTNDNQVLDRRLLYWQFEPKIKPVSSGCTLPLLLVERIHTYMGNALERFSVGLGLRLCDVEAKLSTVL